LKSIEEQAARQWLDEDDTSEDYDGGASGEKLRDVDASDSEALAGASVACMEWYNRGMYVPADEYAEQSTADRLAADSASIGQQVGVSPDEVKVSASVESAADNDVRMPHGNLKWGRDGRMLQRQGPCGWGWYRNAAPPAVLLDIQGGEACDSMRAQSLFQNIENPPVKPAELEAGEALELLQGPCGQGWYVVQQNKRFGLQYNDVKLFGSTSPEAGLTPAEYSDIVRINTQNSGNREYESHEDIVMWKEPAPGDASQSAHNSGDNNEEREEGQGGEGQQAGSHIQTSQSRYKILWHQIRKLRTKKINSFFRVLLGRESRELDGFPEEPLRADQGSARGQMPSVEIAGAEAKTIPDELERYKSLGSASKGDLLLASQKVLPWNNCVAWAETTPGKHHDWCVNDLGPGFNHVGQDKGACAQGFGRGICASPARPRASTAAQQTHLKSRVQRVLDAFLQQLPEQAQQERGDESDAGRWRDGTAEGMVLATLPSSASIHVLPRDQKLTEVMQRLRLAREKQTRKGVPHFFNLPHFFRSKPREPQLPKDKAKAGNAGIGGHGAAGALHRPSRVSTEPRSIEEELVRAREMCAEVHPTSQHAAEMCEMKLWNQLLRQAGAPELLLPALTPHANPDPAVDVAPKQL
jgi:hypothetical protein